MDEIRVNFYSSSKLKFIVGVTDSCCPLCPASAGLEAVVLVFGLEWDVTVLKSFVVRARYNLML